MTTLNMPSDFPGLYSQQSDRHIMVYHDIAEFIEFIPRTWTRHPDRTNEKMTFSDYYCEWAGDSSLTSWDKLLTQLRTPWTKGRGVIDQMIEKLRGADLRQPSARKRKRQWDDVSGDINIDRAMHGDEFMFRSVRRIHSTAAQTVPIVINLTESCNIDADDLLWRGAAAIAAIDSLEASGYQCEVWVYTDARSGLVISPDTATNLIQVKQGSDALDIDTLSCLMSSWFYRRFMLGALFIDPAVSVGHGHGYPSSLPHDVTAELIGSDVNDILFMDRCITERQALEQVQTWMSKFSCVEA